MCSIALGTRILRSMTFREMNLHPDLMEGMDAMGFEKPTPIQEQAIPICLSGNDMIGIAQTGTGKTAAFVLPTIHKILSTPSEGKIKTLIIVPTRELAVQIDQAIEGFAYFTGISSMAIYGGGDGKEFNQEKTALTSGIDIVIATPGRMISHLNLGYVDFSQLQTLILDEADRMLDMGFQRDLQRILDHVNPNRQTLFFSATMPSKIMTFAKGILKSPEVVKIALSKPAEGVLQGAYILHQRQKPEMLVELFKGKDVKSAIVFSSTKKNVSTIHRILKKAGISTGAISSDLEQKEREEVLLQFKNRRIAVLVATDVVSRGIDIDNIELVVNYDVPGDAEDYVHRIGRTARASATGVGITFVSQDEQYKFLKIEELIGSEIRKLAVPEVIGETPEYKPKSGGGQRRFSKPRSGGSSQGNRPNKNRKGPNSGGRPRPKNND